MELTRRQLIACSTLSSAILGLSGCLSQGGRIRNLGMSPAGPRVTFAGNVSTEEPLIENSDFSTEAAYPHYYSALVESENATDKIRWEYIRQEIPQFVDELRETDFGSEFLLFFGMVLPPTKQISAGSTFYKDNTLISEYQIEESSSASQVLSVNTNVKRIKDKVPDDVEFKLTM